MPAWEMPVFWAAICAAFAVNAGGLAAVTWRKRRWLPAALAAAFAFWVFCFSGVPLRGGYDNEHDLQLAGQSFLDAGRLNVTFANKEVSPLAADALADALSGRSLAAVPTRNAVLTLLAAAALAGCLRLWGLSYGAAACGFVLYYFNFLCALNARTVSTTPANTFYLFSSVLAACWFEKRGRNLAGLAWALCALLLVWTGRYELAFMPACLLAVSALRGGGALRGLLRTSPLPAAAMLAAAAALCALWAASMLSSGGYNGPVPSEALRLWAHFRYSLLDNDLAVFSHLPSAACAAAAAATGLCAALAARRGRGDRAALALSACWALYSCAIFSMRDDYPLQFMRHRLYLLAPFAVIAAWAWELPFRGRRAVGAAALALLCCAYIPANVRAARALEPQARTNDMEWRLLVAAARRWPAGTRLAYGPDDHRRRLLEKYFPMADGCGFAGGVMPVKYVPAYCQVFNGPEDGRPAGCSAAWLPGSEAPGSALFESSFAHGWYTEFGGAEKRGAVPVRIGFYTMGSPADLAWLKERAASCGGAQGKGL